MCMAETTDGALLAAQYTVVSSGSEQDLALRVRYCSAISAASERARRYLQYHSTLVRVRSMLQYVLGTDVLVREPLVRVQCVLYGLYAYVSCTVLVRVPVLRFRYRGRDYFL